MIGSAPVVADEKVDADEGSISTLAQAAEGSMRDALSLLDQVIAACGGHLEEKRVRQVLGVVPAELLADILRAVDAADSRRVLEQVGQLAAEGYELAHFCGELTRFVRDLMIGRSCGGDSPSDPGSHRTAETHRRDSPHASAKKTSRGFSIFCCGRKARCAMRWSRASIWNWP